MKIKVLKTEIEYEAALAEIEKLMDSAKPDRDRLELLILLVRTYEDAHYPIDLPDPIEAIKFRMEQMGLKQKDLIPFIGSRSKVSEVLSRQRPLSVTMIRRLNEGMDIPAEVLLKESGAQLPVVETGIEWDRFPLAEMLKRKWLSDVQGTLMEAKKQASELLTAWAGSFGATGLEPALLRQHVRNGSEADGYALAAWRIRVSQLAMEQKTTKYKSGTVTHEFVRDLVRLSYLENGPLLAWEFLMKNGIHFVVEKHLAHTHLDGAAIRLPDGSPLVALTIRHDRLDNFWFTLCHELAHIALHFDTQDVTVFFDDLDHAGIDTFEEEADQWATDALIPKDLWQSANLGRRPSSRAVLNFAASLRIHPAIPAGRIRRETADYRLFSDLIGNKKVRTLFAKSFCI